MTRIELGECCPRFSLLGASTESHKACFFHFSGGFLISNQRVKVNDHPFMPGVAIHNLRKRNAHEKRTDPVAL